MSSQRNELRTLVESEITSGRAATRRSLLGTLGLGLVTVVAVAKPRPAWACTYDNRDQGTKRNDEIGYRECLEIRDYYRSQRWRRERSQQPNSSEQNQATDSQKKEVLPGR